MSTRTTTPTIAIVAGEKTDAGCEAGATVVCCTAGAGVTGKEISGDTVTAGDVVTGSPIVVPDSTAVLFPPVPGNALIA